jgi:DNA-binding winged helix-turn-helix (wHTH) protein/TolB-like protein
MAIQRFDRFVFDAADGRLLDTANGREQRLRPQLANLLGCFLDKPEQVLDRQTLCQSVWGSDTVVDFDTGLSALIKELRQVLGERGDGARLIETLPRRGYRLTCAVSHESWGSRLRRQAPLLLAGAVAVLLITVLLFGRTFAPQLGPTEPPALVVLPTQVYGQSHALPEHIEWRLADAVLTELWNADLNDVLLIGRSSIQAQTQQGVDLEAVSLRLDADLVLETSLQTSGQQWELTARLLKAPSGQVLWQQQSGFMSAPLQPVTSARELVQGLAQEWPSLQQEIRR